MNFNITPDDINKFLEKKANPSGKPPVDPKLALSKQATVQNAIASRQQGKPQGAGSAPTTDGFGRTV